MSQVTATIADFAKRRDELPGNAHAWVREAREEAARHFDALGLPTRRLEAWKYTDLSDLRQAGFVSEPLEADIPDDEGETLLDRLPPSETVSHLAFVNGLHLPAPSRLRPLPGGVRIASLRDVLNREPDLVKGRLGSAVSIDREPMAALNTALIQDGLVVIIPAGVHVESPINLVCFNGGGARSRGIHLRNLIIAEPGARVTLYESHGHLAEGSHLTNVVTEILLGEGACVDHYRVQVENDEATHVALTAVRQDAGSRYSSCVISMGARVGRDEIHATLAGKGAHCSLRGLYMGSGSQHHDNQTHIDHAVADTSSEEFYKGILGGRSTGVFTGRVLVRKDAQRSDAAQQNRNLLLSDDATVASRPQLEIYADDVKCSHGSTTGRLDPLAFHYLRSRGIPADRAKSMLTAAFAWDILDSIGHPQVRASLTDKVYTSLGVREELPED